MGIESMTPRKSFLDNVQHHRDLIKEYKSLIIPRLEKNAQNPKYSPERRKGFSQLLDVANREVSKIERELKDLITKGEISDDKNLG